MIFVKNENSNLELFCDALSDEKIKNAKIDFDFFDLPARFWHALELGELRPDSDVIEDALQLSPHIGLTKIKTDAATVDQRRAIRHFFTILYSLRVLAPFLLLSPLESDS